MPFQRMAALLVDACLCGHRIAMRDAEMADDIIAMRHQIAVLEIDTALDIAFGFIDKQILCKDYADRDVHVSVKTVEEGRERL